LYIVEQNENLLMSKARKIHKDSPKMKKLLDNAKADVKQFKQGELVEGVVVSASHREVLLDVGAKSEGIITGSELNDSDKSYKNLKMGDTTLATVVQAENEQGYIVLSFRRCEKDRKWKSVEDAYDNKLTLEITVLEYNKGGLLADCLGLRGFVPLSHLDKVHFTNDIAKFAAGSEAELKESLKVLSGKTLKVKVIEINKDKNRLVLSEKEAISQISTKDKEKKLANVKKDDILEGVVTGLMPFGIFVDLDGLEGLVHISEIAWEKVNHPGSYFKVGEEIKVKVLGVDESSSKLALSVKRLVDNPWDSVQDKYPIGSKTQGTVSKIVPFGAFVSLDKGLEGLVHISEAAGPLKEGQKVEVLVTLIDKENQRIALSIRQLKDK
jgi:small subunit ribosomal protein S1